MQQFCLVNGVRRNEFDVADRGLQFGDGFFTTIAVRQGNPDLWDYHWRRLVQCGDVLDIPLPDEQLVIEEVRSLAHNNNQVNHSDQPLVVKVIITRGSGGRGYAPPSKPEPTRIISCHSYPAHYDDWAKRGVTLGVAQTRLAMQPALAGLKTLNRLEQVLIKQELLKSSPAQDLLVLDTAGHIVESSAANIFWREGTCWYTPDLRQCGINGVVRQRLLERNPHVKEVRVTVNRITEADEAFLCNSLMGLIPVVSVCQNSFQQIRSWPEGSETLLSN